MLMNLDSQLMNVKTVAIAGHVRPDGDCVGSCLGVYNYISTYYPTVDVTVFLEPIPNIFKFLKGAEAIVSSSEEDRAFDLFIVLDCGDATRLGPFEKYFKESARKICVDHHVSNQAFADENHIVPEASSTCELVYNLMIEEKITPEIAECIYTGIIHDTGVFQYSCTSQHTMHIAGKLMSKGIDFPKIVSDTFYTKTFEQNKILGRALDNARLYLDGKCIASVITQKEMEAFHVLPKHLEGIVSQLRATKDVEVAIFIYENADGSYKVSTRATGDVNLAELAMKYQGGGHAKAAGFTMHGTPEEIINQIVEDVRVRL